MVRYFCHTALKSSFISIINLEVVAKICQSCPFGPMDAFSLWPWNNSSKHSRSSDIVRLVMPCHSIPIRIVPRHALPLCSSPYHVRHSVRPSSVLAPLSVTLVHALSVTLLIVSPPAGYWVVIVALIIAILLIFLRWPDLQWPRLIPGHRESDPWHSLITFVSSHQTVFKLNHTLCGSNQRLVMMLQSSIDDVTVYCWWRHWGL